MLTDANGRPIQSAPTEESDEPKEGNGATQKDPKTQDVRAVPTGQLIYSLIRVSVDEIGLENELNKFEMIKQHEKMVTEPPMVTKIREVHHVMCTHRYIMARELNERFADIDALRRERLGIEIWTPPASPAEENEEAIPSAQDVLNNLTNQDGEE